ncbi:hypothetical protein TWF106_004044 [Orbilia oligospora]|uniref:Copper acquisition factor BIM1-like domain-containing protein n=1 Tax=Orbilia oligospora TaxID=2813651 RepID=A0A6G1LS81_ORBOL|nr:hypothetical protein TWF679_004038 [Orbilia oligospora]KAF3199044.1 hypothetical protein TWF106_004044 [Orbilia oligospora]KAF3201812.1 hypothetical protein TWF191_003230 [Orbilia oligospora]KAF3233083.1 hypothetical protein TWF192_002543 [Orbilia oligospora]
MLVKTLVAAATLATAVQAHYSIEYPTWRADSFEEPYNQWLRPCAGANTTRNRTVWPLDGGSIVLGLHHSFDYIFVNLGLGTEVASFNISLTPNFLNNTGNGTLCLPKVPIPAEIEIRDGQDASIQVVTVGKSGNALYNCADIRFSKDAQILSGDACMNTTSGPLIHVQDQNAIAAAQNDDDDKGDNKNATSGDKPSSAVHGSSIHVLTSSIAVLMAMVVASGLL